MTTLRFRKSIGRSPLRLGLLLIPLGLACFALSAQAWATCQDGCLTNDNTVLGEDALLNNTGISNTAIGFNALYFNTTGSWNTAIGYQALYSGASNFNTAMGYQALYSNTGVTNTAVGYQTLFSNTYGFDNTATGETALHENTTGGLNTADGEAGVFGSSTGSYNTATGVSALEGNTTGNNNTATGAAALVRNTTGNDNTATGFSALDTNTTGIENTANGANALFTNKTGINNTANGSGALFSNRFGSHNTADGFNALYNNRTGAFNIALGDSAGFNITGRNNIDIGNQGIAGESDAIRIGAVGTQTTTFVAGISGVTVAGGVGVVIDTNGQLGTVVSSERFKDNIKPMDKASEAILSLEPVTFHYKHELDPDGIPQFGLVAEQVEKVNSDLVARDEQGKPYTVRYEAVNAMLLNEFLKARRQIDAQQKQIDALTAGLQKVSAQLELSKSAPQTVSNNH